MSRAVTAVPAARPLTPLEALCEGWIEAGWLAAMSVVPLFFNPWTWRIFEPDKSVLLRLIVLAMFLAWSIKVAGGGRAAAPAAHAASAATAADDPSRPRRIPLLVPSLFVLISTALSVAWSVEPRISVAGSYLRAQGLWTTLALVALFFLVLAHLRSARQWRRLLYAMTLASFGVASYAVLQSLKLDPVLWVAAGHRVRSSLGNPIFLAAFLGLAFFPVVGALAAGAGAATRSKARSATWSFQLPTRALVLYTGVLQLFAIVLSRSRGPLLALLTGSFLVLLAFLFAVRSRSLSAPPSPRQTLRRWSWLILIALAIAALVVLWAGNTRRRQLSSERDLGVGRLAAPFDPQSSSAITRLLTWQSGLDLLREGGPTTGTPMQRAARALFGYGPETFRLVFASHDTAARSSTQGGKAMPDRGHNEVLDRLVETGVVGFACWFAWFGTFFYLGATGLFPRRRSLDRLYWPLVIGGAVVGAASPALLGSPHLAFFGLPIGMLAGVGVFLALLSRHYTGEPGGAIWGTRATLIAALLGAAAAHLVEIDLGIAVTATKLYMWCLAAVLVAAHRGWLDLEQPAGDGGEAFTRDTEVAGGLIAGLVAATLIFPMLGNPNRSSNPFAIVADNFAQRVGATPMGAPMWLPMLVLLAALATAVPIDGKRFSELSKSAARFAVTSLTVTVPFLLYHAHRLSTTVALERAGSPVDAQDTIARHGASYQIFVLLWVLVVGAVLFRQGATRERRAAAVGAPGFCRRPWRAAFAALLLGAATVPVVAATLRPLAADALRKQGAALLDAGAARSSLPVLRRAVALAPAEPTYRYELARALVAVAQSAPAGPDRESSLDEARSTLEIARSASPLDPESAANLGNLFAIQASLAVDEEARRVSLERAARELEHALELRPQWVGRMADLAIVEYQRGNRERALALTDKGLALSPASAQMLEARARIQELE